MLPGQALPGLHHQKAIEFRLMLHDNLICESIGEEILRYAQDDVILSVAKDLKYEKPTNLNVGDH